MKLWTCRLRWHPPTPPKYSDRFRQIAIVRAFLTSLRQTPAASAQNELTTGGRTSIPPLPAGEGRGEGGLSADFSPNPPVMPEFPLVAVVMEPRRIGKFVAHPRQLARGIHSAPFPDQESHFSCLPFCILHFAFYICNF